MASLKVWRVRINGRHHYDVIADDAVEATVKAGARHDKSTRDMTWGVPMHVEADNIAEVESE